MENESVNTYPDDITLYGYISQNVGDQNLAADIFTKLTAQ